MNLINSTILHYKILDILGKGGMGVVYKAEDLKLGRIVALKFLSNFPLANQEEISRFEREARTAASLNHPNICTIYEFNQTDEFAFIAMEYIEGETLKQIIKRGGPLPQNRAVEIVEAIAEALSAAHKNGIIHRDIKSDNVMITKDGQVKIMDFGLAKLKDAPTITQSQSPMGTVAYMSPEQIEGKRVTHQTDLWSLGVVFFEMLTGELPFREESDVNTLYFILESKFPNMNHYSINSSLQFVIRKLIARDLSIRYSASENLLRDLQKNSINFKIRTIVLNKFYQHQRKLIFSVIFILFSLFAYYSYDCYFNRPIWLKNKNQLQAIVDDKGTSLGSISPDGKFIAFKDGNTDLRLKDLLTNQSVIIENSENSTHTLPTWSSDGEHIAYISNQLNGISIIDKDGKQVKEIVKKHPGWIFHLSWSPDKKWIAFNRFKTLQKENINSLNIVKTDGSDERIIHKLTGIFGPIQSAWFPDSKKIAFYDFIENGKKQVIRFYNLEEQKISEPIIRLNHRLATYAAGGLTISPDGDYLVYPDKINQDIELIAYNWKSKILPRKAKTIQLTKFSGNGTPAFPYFDRAGDQVSFLLKNSHTGIYTASIDIQDRKLGQDLKLVSLPKGHARDACWNHDGSEISYNSNIDGQPDIYSWNKKLDQISRVTNDNNYEEAIQYVPGKNALSYTVNDTIWQYDLESNSKRILVPFADYFNKTKIMSYTWAKNCTTIYAIVMFLEKSTVYGELIKINIDSKNIEVIETNIYNPDGSLVTSPSGRFLAVATLDTNFINKMKIEVYDLLQKNKRKIINFSSEIPTGDISWTRDGQHLIYGTFTGDSFYHINLLNLKNRKKHTLISRPRMRAWFEGRLSPGGEEMILYLRTNEENLWLMGKNPHQDQKL